MFPIIKPNWYLQIISGRRLNIQRRVVPFNGNHQSRVDTIQRCFLLSTKSHQLVKPPKIWNWKWFTKNQTHKLYKYWIEQNSCPYAHCPASKTVDLKNIKKKTDWEIKQRDCRGQYFDPRTMVSVTRLWSNCDRLRWIAEGRVIPKIDTSDISIVHCCSIANASDWYLWY